MKPVELRTGEPLRNGHRKHALRQPPTLLLMMTQETFRRVFVTHAHLAVLAQRALAHAAALAHACIPATRHRDAEARNTLEPTWYCAVVIRDLHARHAPRRPCGAAVPAHAATRPPNKHVKRLLEPALSKHIHRSGAGRSATRLSYVSCCTDSTYVQNPSKPPEI